MNIPDNIRKTADSFVCELRKIYADGLISATLYGSAASGEHASKHSNINIAVILDDTSLSSIKKISRFMNQRKFLAVNPVFFTEEYVRTSGDVFPIEFLDMKENHATLYGKDVFKDLHIELKNLRFQCEQEFKSKVINIKRLYLRATGKEFVKDLLFRSATSGIHLLRNLVRLKGKQPSYDKGKVLDEAAAEFGIDVEPLRVILDAKKRNLRLDHKKIDSLMTSLVSTLESAADKVDRL